MKLYENTTQKDFIQWKKQINRCFFCAGVAMILISPNSPEFWRKSKHIKFFILKLRRPIWWLASLRVWHILLLLLSGTTVVSSEIYTGRERCKSPLPVGSDLWYANHQHPSWNNQHFAQLHKMKRKKKCSCFVFQQGPVKQHRSVVFRSFTENNRSWQLTDWWT